MAAAVTALASLMALAWLAAPAGAADGCPNAALRAGASAALPDCRAYELVTDTAKPDGRGVGDIQAGDAAAIPGLPSRDGERILSATFSQSITDPTFSFTTDYAESRRTAAGWVTGPANTRQSYGPNGGASGTLVPLAFSTDLGTQTWAGQAGAFLFPEMGDWPIGTSAAYLRSWQGNWELAEPTAPAQVAGGNQQSVTAVSDDGSTVLISNRIRGLAGPGDPSQDQKAGTAGGQSVYEVQTPGEVPSGVGQSSIRLLNVCTGSGPERTHIPLVEAGTSPAKQGTQPCPAGVDGRAALISSRGASIGWVSGALNQATAGTVSHDGVRAFFHAPDPVVSGAGGSSCTAATGAATACPAQLYVSERTAAGPITRWISQTEVPDQDASLMSKTIFEAASRDGSHVFFRTNAPLTADDPNGQELTADDDPRPITTGTPSTASYDLYEYTFPEDPAIDPGAGTLTRISAGPDGTSDGNVSTNGNDQSVRWISDDGTRLYFTTAAPLAGVAGPTDGTSTSPGLAGLIQSPTAKNLYLYDANKTGGARWEFIAQLPVGGSSANCATTGSLPSGPITWSALSGHGLVPTFPLAGTCVRGTADGRLITFMTPGALTADDTQDDIDVYVFDERTDTLSRITRPGGGGDAGAAYPCDASSAGSGLLCNGDLGFSNAGGDANPLLNVADDGGGSPAVFFQSKRRLLPSATSGVYNVYQWRQGALSLVAAGTPYAPAYYSGNSADGRDVFVETRRPLSWQDEDDLMDIYDARRGGGIAEPERVVAPAPCIGDACQGPAPPSPPSSVIGTVGFTGGGNLPSVAPEAIPTVTVASQGTVTGAVAKVKVRVSDRGRIIVAGAAVRRARRAVARAGTSTVRVRLTVRARRALARRAQRARHRLRHRGRARRHMHPAVLRARVRVTFRAADGRTASRRVTIAFRQANAGRARVTKRGRR